MKFCFKSQLASLNEIENSVWPMWTGNRWIKKSFSFFCGNLVKISIPCSIWTGLKKEFHFFQGRRPLMDFRIAVICRDDKQEFFNKIHPFKLIRLFPHTHTHTWTIEIGCHSCLFSLLSDYGVNTHTHLKSMDFNFVCSIQSWNVISHFSIESIFCFIKHRQLVLLYKFFFFILNLFEIQLMNLIN